MWFSTYKPGQVALTFLGWLRSTSPVGMALLPYLKKVSLTWESWNYPVSSAVGVKSLLLNPVENFSGVNSAEGVFEIKVVLPCVPAHNCLLKVIVLKSNN